MMSADSPEWKAKAVRVANETVGIKRIWPISVNPLTHFFIASNNRKKIGLPKSVCSVPASNQLGESKILRLSLSESYRRRQSQ
jgi:hypothetical protein